MLKPASELNNRMSVLADGKWRKPVHVWRKGDTVALVFKTGSVEVPATKMLSVKV